MAQPQISDDRILSVRPPKNPMDPWRPYAFLIEPERSRAGTIDDCLTVFLTNRECPFRCTMCDLWKNTLDERVPLGAIPVQIDHAIQNSSPADHIKLYNAGNFFDPQAIPPEDHSAIAARIRTFQTVIVENHPRLTDDRCLRFRDQLETTIEVAMGLETVNPDVLARLNKRMTVDDFDIAVRFLLKHQIAVRTFLLLKPPGLNEEDGIRWSLESLKHAIEMGVGCVSLIPTRAGNGLMDQLQRSGDFSPPSIRSMELVLEAGLQYVGRFSPATRVFMDLWDAATFYTCFSCGPARRDRIQRMNLTQQVEPAVMCDDCGVEVDGG